jgi:fibronectin-binding autotransporter adhesin
MASALNSTVTFSQSLTNGTVVLTGNNTYTGNTTVSGGMLQADGVFTSPAFTVNSGGALTGVLETSTPNVTVNPGGTLYAGDSGLGGISVKTLTMNAGSNLSFAIASNSLLTTDPITVTAASGLSLLGTNGSPINLSIFSQGSANGFKISGTYTLLAESGLNAFDINGTLASPNGGSGETTSVVDGLTIVNPQGFTTYSLVTMPVGGNTTDLELQVSGPPVSQWGNTGGGSYQNANNWSPPVIPSGSGATANFASAIVAPSTVTVDGQLTVGNLIFNNSHAYTLAPGIAQSTIDLDNDGEAAEITDYLGTHFISVPLMNPLGVSVTVANAPDAVNISNAISGAGGLTMSGLGTLVLSASNTFSGVTIINSGTVQLGNGSSSGTLGTSTGPIVVNGTLTFDQPSGATQSFTNVLTTSASGGVSQLGAGSLIVLNPGGADALTTGSVSVAAGTLRIGNANAANLGSLTMSGGTLDLNGLNTTFTSLAGAGGVIDSSTGNGLIDLTVGANNTTTTFAGVIRNTSGTLSLQKLGNGVLVLSGANTFTGPTNIANGGLRLTQSNSLNTLSPIQVNSLGFGSGGGLILSNGVTLANPITTNNESFEFVNLPDANSTATLTGPINSIAGSQFRLGFPSTTSTLILQDTMTVPAAQIVDLTQGNLIFDGTSSIQTSGSTIFLGRSTTDPLNLVMNNQSSINNPGTVGMTIGGGVADHQATITLNNASSLNAGSGDFELDNSTAANSIATVNLNGGTITAGSFTYSATAATASATVNFNGGVISAAASSTNFLPVNSTDNFYLNIEAGGAAFDTNGFNEVVASPQGFNSSNGSGGSTGGGLVKDGPGELVVASGFGASAAVAYSPFTPFTGAITVNGGLLEFANGTQNGQLTGASHISVFPGGAVGVDSGSTSDTKFLSLMTGSGAPTAQLGALALSPADDFVNINYSGVVAGDFNMSKPVSTSSDSFASMSLGATANYNGTAYAPTIYAGRITPANHQYMLGGGGTLEMAQTSTGTPLVDVSGATSLLAENGGDVLLETTNTYTGPTTITATSVLTEPGSDLPSQVSLFTLEPTTLSVKFLADTGSGIGLSAVGTPSNLIINGGAFQYVGAAATSDRVFTIGALGATLDGSGTGAITFASTAAEAFSATISTSLVLTGTYGAVVPGTSHVNTLSDLLVDPSGGSLSLTKNGTGAWALTNTASSYSGGTTINAGVLQAGVVSAGSVGVFGSATGAMTVNTGGTLDLNGNNVSVGTLSGGGLIDSIKAASSSAPLLTVGAGNLTSTFSGVIQNTTGTVGLIVAAGTLVLAGANTYSGGTSINGGVLQIGAGGASGSITGPVVDATSLIINRSDTAGFTFANSISGAGNVSVTGAGTVTFTGANTYGGSTTVSAGTLVIGKVGALPLGGSVVNSSALSIQAGSNTTPINPATITGAGTIAIGTATTPGYLSLGSTTGAQTTTTASSITFGTSSALNINNNTVAINYSSAATDPAAQIRAAIASAYSNDSWTGVGITSGNAAANPGLYAVGYADGNVDAGTPAAANQILIENTLAGDANLDGTVNFADLLVVAQNFNHTLDTHGNPLDWADGDFNYDGQVNFADLLLVAQNFNKRLSAGQLEQLPGSFAADWNLALAELQATQSNNVPEPAMVSLLAAGAVGLLARRRRARLTRSVAVARITSHPE